MPNANSVIRAMTWGIIMEKLSTQVSRYLRKIKEKASPFTAGMNPTVLIQPTFGMLNECFKCLHIV